MFFENISFLFLGLEHIHEKVLNDSWNWANRRFSRIRYWGASDSPNVKQSYVWNLTQFDQWKAQYYGSYQWNSSYQGLSDSFKKYRELSTNFCRIRCRQGQNYCLKVIATIPENSYCRPIPPPKGETAQDVLTLSYLGGRGAYFVFLSCFSCTILKRPKL